MAITSKDINLTQLDLELGSKGLIADFNDANNKIILAAENSDVTEEQIETAILNHVATDPNAARVAAQAKLAALGLTTDDLKALGL
jgi:hypothetical protein